LKWPPARESFNRLILSTRGFKKMGEDSFIAARRRARTVALQILYEVDSVYHPLDQVSGRYLTAERLPKEAISFARGLVEGVVANAIPIDGIISEFAPTWPVSQLSVVDRNLLRLAIYELTIEMTSPTRVVINETVKLAKLYGSDNSFRFINGVLGSVVEAEKLSTR
jgi:N utilization substance protein B